MASIGNLVVNITANASPLLKGLKQAESMLTGFAAAAVAGAAASVASFISVGSALQDMSDRTGVSAQALSTLKFAAEQTDTSLESLQRGLSAMARFMAGAGQSGSKAVQAIAALGLKVSDLQAKNPEERFKAFADALSKIEDPGERAALAMQVFGKGAIDLLPLLNGGAIGIEALQEQARKLGLEMSNNTAASAEQLGDSIDKATSSIKMAVVQFGGLFAPALSKVAETMAFAIGRNKELVQTIGILVGVLGTIVLAWRAVTIATQAYAKAVAIAQGLSGPAGWAALAASIAIVTVTTIELDTAFRTMNAEMELAQPVVNGVKQEVDALAAAIEDKMAPAADKLRKAMDPLKESGYADALRNVVNEIRILHGVATEASIELERMAAAGVGPAALRRLQQLWEYRDRLIAQQEAARKAAEEEARAEAEAERAAEAAAVAQNIGRLPQTKTLDLRPTAASADTQRPSLGAVRAGSAEAFSLIADLTRKKNDPLLAATEDQTKEVVKAVNAVGNMIGGIGLGAVLAEFPS